MVTDRGTIRWWDSLLVLILTTLGSLIVLLGGALLLGMSLRALGYNHVAANIAANSKGFFALQVYAATFYLAGLLVIKFLVKRRGYQLFTRYFPPIGLQLILRAEFIGSGIAGFYLIVIQGLAWISVLPLHPAIAAAAVLHQRLGRLLTLALVYVVIAPLAEEIYFRGLLLDSLQQKFFLLPSALITTAVFAAMHVQFLLHPGVVGWLATIALATMGLFNALSAQCMHSLRAPVAAHASYNAVLFLFIFFVR